MKELLCGIVFILYVDYKYFINPYSWIKREKMSDHYFKCMPIDRFNHFDRYVKFYKFNKVDKFDRFDKFFWYDKFCWFDKSDKFYLFDKSDKFYLFDKSDKFDQVDILENLKDMTSFTVLNKRSYCIIGWGKNMKSWIIYASIYDFIYFL